MLNVKIGLENFAKVCNVNEIDLVLTDWETPEEDINKVLDTGVEVIIVKEIT